MMMVRIRRRFLPVPQSRFRRGAVLVWFVYVIPLMMLLLFALTDYGTTARTGIELKNAIDASALSAVKSWNSLGSTAAFRDADETFRGNAVLGTNRSLTSTVADRQSPDFLGRSTEVTFGVLEDRQGLLIFHPISQQQMTGDRFQGPASSALAQRSAQSTSTVCVRVRRSIVMTGVGKAWQEAAFGNYSITAESFARLCPERKVPQLVHVDQISAVPGSWETVR